MRILILFILGAGFYLPMSLFAGDLEAGKIKAQASCAVCHGLDGQATVAMTAHLSGQQKDYFIIQMRAYRSGQRQHSQMSIIAKPLSNEDIENLAEWYSNINVKIEMPTNSNPEVVEKPKETSTEKSENIENENSINPEAVKSIQAKLNEFSN